MAGGLVIGPSGWRPQWDARDLTATGEDVPTGEGLCPKLSGTNMAMTRTALTAVGGFDPGFAYYHDDSDMALRMHRAGRVVAWKPDAVVHHDYAASARRGVRAVPRDLTAIGLSTRRFCEKHASGSDAAALRGRMMRREWRRLDRFIVLGLLSGREAGRLLRDLGAAFDADPRDAQTSPPAVTAATATRHLSQIDGQPGHVALVPHLFARRTARRDAERLRMLGYAVTLIEMRYSPRRLRVRFTRIGLWHHLGGTFSRGAFREHWAPPLRYRPASARELARCASVRLVDHVVTYDLRGTRRYRALRAMDAPVEQLFSMPSERIELEKFDQLVSVAPSVRAQHLANNKKKREFTDEA
ncbi:MAG: hypothetical protein AAGJ96_11255, partial [Pseudomonadota bacterium]